MAESRRTLYPEIEPFERGMLKVSELHTLYYEQCGNPNGKPVVFVHGGPGGGTNPNRRRFFDPAVYRLCCSISAAAASPRRMRNCATTPRGIWSPTWSACAHMNQ